MNHECRVSPSRAYELIAIANGSKTLQEVRAGKAERMAATRDRRQQEPDVRHVAETQAPVPQELSAPEIPAAPPKKRPVGRPPGSPTENELKAINRLLKSKSLDQLRTIRALIESTTGATIRPFRDASTTGTVARH